MKIKFAGTEMQLLGNQIKIGEKAPNFTALNVDLQPISLNDYSGAVVINVVPSLDTGVCDLQTQRFNNELAGKNITVVTISNDLPFAQARWCGNVDLENVITLSDYKDNDFSTKYGTLIKELRLQTRAVIVINNDGYVTYTDYVEEITNHPNYNTAMEAINKVL